MGRLVFMHPGDEWRVTLPHSEVCCHMRVAGRSMRVYALLRGDAVQLLNDDGSLFSHPILPEEAGVRIVR